MSEQPTWSEMWRELRPALLERAQRMDPSPEQIAASVRKHYNPAEAMVWSTPSGLIPAKRPRPKWWQLVTRWRLRHGFVLLDLQTLTTQVEREMRRRAQRNGRQ